MPMTSPYFSSSSAEESTETNPVGTILTQKGSNSMAAAVTIKARSVTITAGTWIVTGNLSVDASDLSSGYVKGILSETYNSYDNYMKTQFDIDSNENDISFTVMPLYITVTEDTTIFLNFEREDSTNAISLYSKIQAARIA